VKIEHIAVAHYLIPLPMVLSDATHGRIENFGLITVRVECEGQSGLGYTYTVGPRGAAAVKAILSEDGRAFTGLSEEGSRRWRYPPWTSPCGI